MPRGRTLFILDSVAAARALLSSAAVEADTEILSTHYSVVGFLAARSIECRDFSDFISAEQAKSAIESASRELDVILGRLDRTVGAQMCAAAGLPAMELFHAAFKYLGQYNHAGMKTFERLLDARLGKGDVGAVVSIHARNTSSHPVFSFLAAAERVCRARGVEHSSVPVAPVPASRLVCKLHRVGSSLIRNAQSPGKLVRAMASRLRRLRASKLATDAPCLLLLNPGIDSFFESALAGSGVPLLTMSVDGNLPAGAAQEREVAAEVGRMTQVASEWVRARSAEAVASLDTLFVTSLIANAEVFLGALVRAHRVLQSRQVSGLAWDDPPVSQSRLNLLVELFLSTGRPVLGRQHGANYVCQDLGSIHFDSDFNRCTHFFSYGCGPDEFVATYPQSRARCQFVPAGNPPSRIAQGGRALDIAFPITMCLPLFYLARLPESELARRQAQILSAMEARHDLNCVVKPLPGFSEHDCAHVEMLRALRHVRILQTTWTRFLERWRPRLVVFEVASTPLIESLHLDVDVFLMLDPLFPFPAGALEMLRKRVHVFDTVEALAEAIRRYGLQAPPRLRDDTFYRTYVNRGSSAAVLDVIGTTTAHALAG